MRTSVKGSIDDRSMPVTAAPTSRMQMRHHCVCERFRETEMPHSFTLFSSKLLNKNIYNFLS